ncbi:hypothetical protein [Streptomyces sp. NPDC047014]
MRIPISDATPPRGCPSCGATPVPGGGPEGGATLHEKGCPRSGRTGVT